MNVLDFANDKYIGFRLEGFGCDQSFGLARYETHRYLMDFVYYSGEAMPDQMYSEMVYVLEDMAFTQNAEFSYQMKKQQIKSPA